MCNLIIKVNELDGQLHHARFSLLSTALCYILAYYILWVEGNMSKYLGFGR